MTQEGTQAVKELHRTIRAAAESLRDAQGAAYAQPLPRRAISAMAYATGVLDTLGDLTETPRASKERSR